MVDLEEAKRRATELRTQADMLIAEKGILEVLQKFGSIQFTGSYAAGVMVKPDIDMQIIGPNIKDEDVIEIARYFFGMEGNYSVEIADGMVFRRSPGHPIGYYVGPWIMFSERKWKIDIWLLREPQEIMDSPYVSLRTHDWYKHIDQQTKDAITLIKHQLVELDEYSKYASANVYEAVITGGVRTLTEFYEWTKTFDTEQLFMR